MKYRILLLLFILSIFLPSRAQTLIQGTVREGEKKENMAGINIMIRENQQAAILGFTTTDKNGQYKIEYKGTKDSLIVSLSGFNIQKQSKTIANKSQTVDFDVEREAISLKEVKVTPPRIRQVGDTLNYAVDGFVDKNDRTIGDVLKKMPGIDVKESGAIYYQNKPINKFYIEGLDLLQGRYGIATNNIEAKDVRTVQVMENHQPIKALKERILSEQAAINLKLKDSAKGTITANALLGAGFSPLLWNGELSGMYFAKGKQNISTYKGNNVGFDASGDFNSFYSREADLLKEGGMLSVQSPAAPSINRRRYLFNQLNTFSFNNLWKTGKDYQINANINYTDDRQDRSSYARTEYYLPGDSLLRVEEKLDSRLFVHQLNAEAQLNVNKDKFYLNNLLKMNGSWDNERGNAITTDSIRQHLDKPVYGMSNTFEMIRNFDKTALNISSFNGYTFLPQTLNVQPVLYANLFEQTSDLKAMRQELTTDRFSSNTKASVGFEKGSWKQNYALSFRADLQHLDSELQAENKDNSFNPAPDSLKNDLKWNKYEWIFLPSYTYIYDNFRASLSLPLNYTLLHRNDRIFQEKENTDRFYLNPSLLLQYKLSVFWDVTGSLNYTNSLGNIRNGYAGYIMKSYRNLMRNEGELYETNTQNYSINLNYRNPLRSLFGYAHAGYFNNKANLLYGYHYDGILQVQTSMDYPNRTEGVNVFANVSKVIDAIASTIRLSGSYTGSSSSQISQDEVVKFKGQRYSVTPSISTKIKSLANVSYELTFSENQNKVENDVTDFDPIRTVSQRASLNVFPVKGLIVNFAYEYFYNSAIASGNRAMSFGDAGLKYKWKKMEFQLDYTNIFNSKRFVSASYSDISTYYYAYDLRPSEVLLRVRFKIK